MAVALGALAAAFASPAPAQTDARSLFQPSLQDPRNTGRFGRPPDGTTRSTAPQTSAAPPPGAGSTGFDLTGSTGKKKKKRRPGERHLGGKLSPAPAAPLSGPPQPVGGRSGAPQTAERATYANAYRAPGALSPPRRPPVPPGDPFEPVSVRAGEFVLRPSIEINRGYDSNPARVPEGKGSQFTQVVPDIALRSLWSRHELAATIRGSYSAYDSMPDLNRPSAEARVTGRIDASRDASVDLEARYLLGTDYPGSPNLTAGLSKLPMFNTFGGSAGVTQRLNHLELSAKVSADRTVWQDSKLTDGSTFSNRDRDYDQYGGQLRASYEITPGVKPFVEVGADKRVHDLAFDRNGERRDSRAFTPKAGTTFEMSRLLTGEVSVGYLTREYEDPALADLRGVVADASLRWIASGLTTATLTASSRADESTVAGVSGALRRDAGLQIDHAFRRWLIGTVKFGYGLDQYVGLGRDDRRMSIGAALTYKFNREISLKGEFRQEWLHSNVPDVAYDASIFMLGLKLQR